MTKLDLVKKEDRYVAQIKARADRLISIDPSMTKMLDDVEFYIEQIEELVDPYRNLDNDHVVHEDVFNKMSDLLSFFDDKYGV